MDSLRFNGRPTSLQKGDLIAIDVDCIITIHREGVPLTFQNGNSSLILEASEEDYRTFSNKFLRILSQMFGIKVDDISHTVLQISKQVSEI